MERSRYMNEPILKEILDSVNHLSSKTDATFEAVLGAISTLSAKTDERFEEVFEALHDFSGSVDQRFASVEKRFISIDQCFDGMDRRLVRLENQMVTKSYLDEKLADLTSDLVRRWRTEDDLVVTRLEKKFSK